MPSVSEAYSQLLSRSARSRRLLEDVNLERASYPTQPICPLHFFSSAFDFFLQLIQSRVMGSKNKDII